MNRRKVSVVANQPKTLFLNQKGQEGTRTKKGTHTGETESTKEASGISKWKGRAEREAGSVRGKTQGWGGGRTYQPPMLHGVGPGWSATFLPLASGHEFESHTDFQLGADCAVTLPLSVQETRRTSKRRSVKETESFPVQAAHDNCLQHPVRKGCLFPPPPLYRQIPGLCALTAPTAPEAPTGVVERKTPLVERGKYRIPFTEGGEGGRTEEQSVCIRQPDGV